MNSSKYIYILFILVEVDLGDAFVVIFVITAAVVIEVVSEVIVLELVVVVQFRRVQLSGSTRDIWTTADTLEKHLTNTVVSRIRTQNLKVRSTGL